MLLKEFISEVIQTSAIDQACRKILESALHDNIDNIINFLKKSVTPKKNEYGEIDYSDLYDRMSENYRKIPMDRNRMDHIYRPILSVANQNLTNLLTDHLPAVLARSKRDETEKKNILRHSHVVIEIREYSLDKMKEKSGGYYSEPNYLIKIFVDNEDLSESILELIQENVLGEKLTNHHYTNFIKRIVSIFSHEYAHLEQNLLDTRKTDKKDFGYITSGEKKKGGKRGGIMRTPWAGDADQLRYRGNLAEIDSFASEAASEMVNTILSNKRSWNINDIIDFIYDDLKYGYSESKQHSVYTDMLHNTFNGAYADKGINLKPQEVKKVYQRFLKLVYQKLNNYRTKDIPNTDPRWTRAVNDQSRTEAIRSIAMMAADDFKKHAKDWGYDQKETIDKIKSGSLTYSEENFLINTYKIGIDKEGWKSPTGFEERFRDYVAKLYSR